MTSCLPYASRVLPVTRFGPRGQPERFCLGLQEEPAERSHLTIKLSCLGSFQINEEATNLSQGQKQLLTIARAFVADPAILILDEATSSVDTRTEVLIQKAMAQLMHGRTTFVIAHRLSTIRNANLILMMEHGRIVEKGSHEGLLAANGRYADLYR